MLVNGYTVLRHTVPLKNGVIDNVCDFLEGEYDSPWKVDLAYIGKKGYARCAAFRTPDGSARDALYGDITLFYADLADTLLEFSADDGPAAFLVVRDGSYARVIEILPIKDGSIL